VSTKPSGGQQTPPVVAVAGRRTTNGQTERARALRNDYQKPKTAALETQTADDG